MQRRHFLGLPISLLGWPVLAAADGMRTKMVFDPRYQEHQIMPEHPESPERYQAINRALMDADLLNQRLRLSLREDADAWLSTVHPKAHIQQIRDEDNAAYHAALLATGGALAAVNAVMAGEADNVFCISRPPGHHATDTGREEGFCYFNHVAVAARYLQQHHDIQKVLIIDWDYHHGNGTEWAFYDDPSVLVFSTHDQQAYPGTGDPSRTGEGEGEGFNINVHLPCGSGDDDIVQAFQEKLIPSVEAFQPEFILVSAGFDSRIDDRLGCFDITDDGFDQLTAIVKNLAHRFASDRLVSVLEGGYNTHGTAQAVVSHLTALKRPL